MRTHEEPYRKLYENYMKNYMCNCMRSYIGNRRLFMQYCTEGN